MNPVVPLGPLHYLFVCFVVILAVVSVLSVFVYIKMLCIHVHHVIQLLVDEAHFNQRKILTLELFVLFIIWNCFYKYAIYEISLKGYLLSSRCCSWWSIWTDAVRIFWTNNLILFDILICYQDASFFVIQSDAMFTIVFD